MKAVIFDMDGVIVDSEPLHIQHLHAYLRKLGIQNPETFKGNLKGVNARDTWNLLKQEFDISQDTESLIVEARASYIQYLENLPELPSIAGSVETVKKLSDSGYVLALASSAAPKRIDLFLQKLAIRDKFLTIVSGDDVERSKPAPDIFLLAAENLNEKPENCVVIEDAQNGVQAAKAAGMYCIAYGGSDHNDDDLSDADVVVTEFESVETIIRSAL